MNEKVLAVNNLSVEFDAGHGVVNAVRNVSFDIDKGEVFALVGESGCGKSTTAMSIMNLIGRAGRISAGEILFGENDLLTMTRDELSEVRGKHIGMIFQNPLDSLNPVYQIGKQLSEGLIVDKIEKSKAWGMAEDMMRDVNINDVKKRIKSYPHEISGGMRQRVMIGMMLCRKPELLIADEPTTALDVTIQAGIIELMKDLQKEYNTSVLLITHDFGIVADMADRIGVMYAGELVEMGDVYEIFDNPKHPYTKLLMKALPTIKKTQGRLQTIKGSVADLTNLPPGCSFADRCPFALDACRQADMVLEEVAPNHFCSCIKAKGGELL